MNTEIPDLLRTIVPVVGQVWEWEPTLAHAHARCVVVEVKWNGEAVWVLSEGKNGQFWNELDRWVEAAVLIGTEDDPAPGKTEIERLNDAIDTLDAYRKKPGGGSACHICGHRVTRHESNWACLRAALLAIDDVLRAAPSDRAETSAPTDPDSAPIGPESS